MPQQKEIYKCEKCGNIIEVLHGAAGKLVCCGQEMTLLKENTVDAAQEKHVPVVEKNGDTVTVSVGSVPHPMEDKHYIEMIEVVTSSKIYRQYLKPGQEPKAAFSVDDSIVMAREYCNIHGLWKSE